MDAIYLDFQKAFDVVDIGLLCHRMRSKGVTGSIGVWLHNFLTSRRQQVLVNNALSDFTEVTSGVPQGTVLGPLLFLILIDSMGELEIEALLMAFVDDSKIATKILSESDIHMMQDYMNIIYNWQASNNMKFNFGKFKWLLFGVRPKSDINYNYFGPDYDETSGSRHYRPTPSSAYAIHLVY